MIQKSTSFKTLAMYYRNVSWNVRYRINRYQLNLSKPCQIVTSFFWAWKSPRWSSSTKSTVQFHNYVRETIRDSFSIEFISVFQFSFSPITESFASRTHWTLEWILHDSRILWNMLDFWNHQLLLHPGNNKNNPHSWTRDAGSALSLLKWSMRHWISFFESECFDFI
jgi:hypothetical protein